METKNNRISSVEYEAEPGRYVLVDGNQPGAPTCKFGNRHPVVGFDTITKQYVRFTKSVFKKLLSASEATSNKVNHQESDPGI